MSPLALKLIALPFILLILAALKVAVLHFVRRGMPDPYPPFEGGVRRLNKAIFIKTLVGWSLWVPIIGPMAFIANDDLDEFATRFPLVLAMFAYMLAHDWMVEKLQKHWTRLDILNEYDAWVAQCERESRSRFAGQKRHRNEKKKAVRRWTIDHFSEERESDLTDRRPPLSELR